ncbi:pyrroline-5-carboxylate reductase [Marinicella sp. W31]|uniref:pyrroline-5-carboxylate reductase n=1 Tax=Marinicella sp. W31 TaxID=3023713 RepID=UPI0037569FFA
MVKAKEELRIRFVGAGNMASSLIGGLLNCGFNNSQINASEPDAAQRHYVESEFRISVYADNNSNFGYPDIVILAVKPQVMKAVLADVGDKITATKPLIISVAAGITIEQMAAWINPQATHAIVRTMPNTPALIGQGAIGMFANAFVLEAQKSQTEDIMSAVGTALWVENESLIDSVTALSGSGPAYFFAFMEALQTAAEDLGLSTEQAAILTQKTASGAALLAERSSEELATLRQRVTSPNGTTAAALDSFERDRLKQAVKHAVTAAHERSIELSKEFD